MLGQTVLQSQLEMPAPAIQTVIHAESSSRTFSREKNAPNPKAAFADQ